MVLVYFSKYSTWVLLVSGSEGVNVAMSNGRICFRRPRVASGSEKYRTHVFVQQTVDERKVLVVEKGADFR